MPAYCFDEHERVLYFIDLHGLTRLTPDGSRTLTHATTGRWALSEIEARDALGDQSIPGGALDPDALRGQSGSLDVAGGRLLLQYNARFADYPNRIEFRASPHLRLERRAGDPFGIPPDVHFFSGNQALAYVQNGELVIADWRIFASEYVEVETPEVNARALVVTKREPSRIAGYDLHDRTDQNLPEIRFGRAATSHRPATSHFRLSPDGAFAFFDGDAHCLYFGRLAMDSVWVHWQAPVALDSDLLTIAPAQNGLFVGAQLGNCIDTYFIRPDGSRTRFTEVGVGLPERTRDDVVYQTPDTPNHAAELVWYHLRTATIKRRTPISIKQRIDGNRTLPLSGAGQLILGPTRTLWRPWHGLSLFDLDAERELPRRLGGKSKLFRLYFASRGTPHASQVDTWIEQAMAPYIVRRMEDIADQSGDALVLGGQVYCWDYDTPIADWLPTALQTAWHLFQHGYVRAIQVAGGPAECAFMSDQLAKLGYRWPDQFNPAHPTYATMKQLGKRRIILCGPLPDLARRVFLARTANIDAIGFDTHSAAHLGRLTRPEQVQEAG